MVINYLFALKVIKIASIGGVQSPDEPGAGVSGVCLAFLMRECRKELKE